MNDSLLELNDLSLTTINGGSIKDLSYEVGKAVGWWLHETHNSQMKSASNIMKNHVTIRR